VRAVGGVEFFQNCLDLRRRSPKVDPGKHGSEVFLARGMIDLDPHPADRVRFCRSDFFDIHAPFC
jgi:hypothetical protein